MNEMPEEKKEEAREVALATMPPVARWIITISTGLWHHVWEGLTDWLPKIVTAWWDGFTGRLSAMADIVEDAVTETTPEYKAFTVTMADMLTDIRKLPSPLDWFLIVFTFLSGTTLYIKEKIRLALLPVGQDLNQEYQTDIAPLEAVVREWFRTPGDREIFQTLIEKYNLSPEAQTILLDSIEQFPDLNAVFALRNRGILPEDANAVWYIQKLGFTEEGANTMLNLRWVIPPLTDIIRLAVREAFSPEAIEKFDLEQHYPEELTAWAEKQGLTEDWARKYWIAHWDLPSLQQGYEMMWRTDFSEDDLDLLMRFADVNPYFRPYLKKIAHRPYTRVDARRMHDVGVLDRAQLKTAYTDIGYDEEHAENMTIFTERYNRRSYTQDLVNEWLWMLEEKVWPEQKVYEEVVLLLDDQKMALFEVKKVQARKALRFFSDQVKTVKTLYTSRRISYNTASDRLDSIGSHPEDKADLLEEWGELRRAKARYASKADLMKYLKSGAIEHDEWISEMRELGYATKYIGWALKHELLEMGLPEAEVDREMAKLKLGPSV